MSKGAWGTIVAAVVACAGCEAVKGLPDGGPGTTTDARGPIDGGDFDAAPPFGAVEIRAFDQNDDPAAGVRVVFHDPDGEIVGSAFTDSSGIAALDEFETGGLVTVAFSGVDNGSTFHFLLTVADVRAGDVISFGPRQPAPSFERMGDVRVATTSVLPDASKMLGMVGCHVVEATSELIFDFALVDDECTRGRNPADFLFLARGDSSIPSAFQMLLAVDVTEGSSGDTIVLGDWREDFTELRVDYPQMPPGAEGAVTDVDLMRGDVRYDMGFQMFTPAGSDADARLPLPRSFAQSLQVRSIVDFGAALGTTRGSIVLQNLPPTTTEFSQNLAETALPPVSNVVRTPITLSRDRVSWQTNQVAFAEASAGLVQIQWSQSTQTTFWSWSALIPPDTESPFEFPVVPDDIVTTPTDDPAWPPPSVTARVDRIDVLFADAPHVGDWNAMRRQRGIAFFHESANWLPVGQIDPPVVRMVQSTRFP